jgi:uncharacterized protein (DUF58 family)
MRTAKEHHHGTRRGAGSPEELMAKVRRLRVLSLRLVDELFAGEYHSAFRGRGVEFAEVREYQPGDDVRTIDWNVTARENKPFVKQFDEERELTIMLAVDLSASGAFGSADEAKRERAAEVAAVLALAAAKNGDKTGLLLFTDHAELLVPPEKGLKHATRIIRDALGFEPHGAGTNLAGALEELARTLRKKSVVFLFSDFLDAAHGEGGYERPLRALASRHDVVAVTVRDPREGRIDRGAMYGVVDLETGRRRMVDLTSKRARRAYSLAAVERDAALARVLAAAGVDRIDISTDGPYIDALLRFFTKRERRARR